MRERRIIAWFVCMKWFGENKWIWQLFQAWIESNRRFHRKKFHLLNQAFRKQLLIIVNRKQDVILCCSISFNYSKHFIHKRMKSFPLSPKKQMHSKNAPKKCNTMFASFNLLILVHQLHLSTVSFEYESKTIKN